MAYQIFTWRSTSEVQGTSTFKVLSAQFGDGYKQAVGDGLNNESGSWQLQFVGGKEYIAAIRDFLKQHKGFRPFEWQPPFGDSSLYEVNEYTITPQGGTLYMLHATFQQRFAP